MGTALTVAGSDPSGGAGIQADLKTFMAFGVYGMSAITAITVQQAGGVLEWVGVGSDLVTRQVEAVAGDRGIHSVKTGMCGTAATIEALGSAIRTLNLTNLVVDPVLKASDGTPLCQSGCVEAYRQWLIPMATIVTPNIAEAECLLDLAIRNAEERIRAAELLLQLGCRSVLITGGDDVTSTDRSIDLFHDGHDVMWLEEERIATTSTHGTGCTLSAAVAAGLARGWRLHDAVRAAKRFTTEALRHATRMGQGHGPLNHAWPGRLPYTPGHGRHEG